MHLNPGLSLQRSCGDGFQWAVSLYGLWSASLLLLVDIFLVRLHSGGSGQNLSGIFDTSCFSKKLIPIHTKAKAMLMLLHNRLECCSGRQNSSPLHIRSSLAPVTRASILDALISRSTCLLLTWGKSQAEPHVAAPVARRVAVAIGRVAVPRGEVPAAAANHAVRAC